MLPSTPTTYSLMCAWEDDNREMNAWVLPLSTTSLVCSDILEAMLVKAQAD